MSAPRRPVECVLACAPVSAEKRRRNVLARRRKWKRAWYAGFLAALHPPPGLAPPGLSLPDAASSAVPPTPLENKFLRVIKKSLVKKCLKMMLESRVGVRGAILRDPSCTEFLLMAAETRRRLPIITTPMAPLLRLCDVPPSCTREIKLENKPLRVIKKPLVKKCVKIDLEDAPYGEQVEVLLRHISRCECTDAQLAERLCPADLPNEERENFFDYVAAGRKYFLSQDNDDVW